LRRKNEPIRQGQDGHCRLLLFSGNVVQRSSLWPRTPPRGDMRPLRSAL
jgi:hypothetical protein